MRGALLPYHVLELCLTWPAETSQHYLSCDHMGAKSNPLPQPPSAASVDCMHIHIFNKMAVT